MARINDPIGIPEGGATPSLGSLLGTRANMEPVDENGEPITPPSIFGPETDEKNAEFFERHSKTQDRTAYHLKQAMPRDIRPKDKP